MCYQLVELYSSCRCLYYQHAVDRCASYGRPGHSVTKRTILVGYACQDHSSRSSYASYSSAQYSDSGYHSSRSSHKSSRHYRRHWAGYLSLIRSHVSDAPAAPAPAPSESAITS